MPKCKNDNTRSYKGTEPSPKGLGYCAHAEKINTKKKGKDGNLWIVAQTKTNVKRWISYQSVKKKSKANNTNNSNQKLAHESKKISIDISPFIDNINVNFSLLKPLKNNPFQLTINENQFILLLPNELLPELNKKKIYLDLNKIYIYIYENKKNITINALKYDLVIDIWLKCKKTMKIYDEFINLITKIEEKQSNYPFIDARYLKVIELHHFGKLVQLNYSDLKKLNVKNKYYIIDSHSGQGWNEDYTGKYNIYVMTPNEIKDFYYSGNFKFNDIDFPLFIVQKWNKSFNHKKLPKAALYNN